MADDCEVCAYRKARQKAGEPLCKFCEFGTCFVENDELVCRSCDKVNGETAVTIPRQLARDIASELEQLHPGCVGAAELRQAI